MTWIARVLLAAIPATLLGMSAYGLGLSDGGDGGVASGLGWVGLTTFAASLVAAVILARSAPRGERASHAATTLLVVVAATSVFYVACWAGALAIGGGHGW
ncbi:hypothetical protein [Microbacterium sp. P04]|uniref:hypothetical protein n=1 Tax=Microbacterium sp. P04 TaxID=3366947 RepID=UPI0037459E74